MADLTIAKVGWSQTPEVVHCPYIENRQSNRSREVSPVEGHKMSPKDERSSFTDQNIRKRFRLAIKGGNLFNFVD